MGTANSNNLVIFKFRKSKFDFEDNNLKKSNVRRFLNSQALNTARLLKK